jgi:hypothetical protein
MPANAGIQGSEAEAWIPAFAGMTEIGSGAQADSAGATGVSPARGEGIGSAILVD